MYYDLKREKGDLVHDFCRFPVLFIQILKFFQSSVILMRNNFNTDTKLVSSRKLRLLVKISRLLIKQTQHQNISKWPGPEHQENKAFLSPEHSLPS